MIISILNIKGGVSKTTTAVNLADCAAREGRQVLCVDLDAAQRDLMDFKGALDGVRFQSTLMPLHGTVIIADCAPFLDKTSAPMMAQSTLIVVPMQPNSFSYKATLTMLEAAPKIAPSAKLKVLLTMYSAPYFTARDEIRAALGDTLFQTIIPRSRHIEAATDARQSVLQAAPLSVAARAYKRLWSEIKNELY